MKVTYRLASKDLASIPAEAAWAEAMGYDGISKNETSHDSFLALTLAATSTNRATLQTSVAIAFPRSPMITAYTARDLQDLSGGRFRLGLGTQVKGHIERRFSTSWESPGPRLREYVQAVRHIWRAWETGERLDYQGKHYRHTLMTPFFSPGPSEYPAPEVFTAAVNAYNCQVAGEVADGLMLHTLISPQYVREVVRPGLVKGAERGRQGRQRFESQRRRVHHHRAKPVQHPGGPSRREATHRLLFIHSDLLPGAGGPRVRGDRSAPA